VNETDIQSKNQVANGARPPRVRSRWWKRIAIAVLALILLGAGYVALVIYLAGQELREAIAEADQLDPGWRFEELEAKRAVIPDEQNAALRVQAAVGLLPNPWPPSQPTPAAAGADLEKSLNDLVPTVALSPEQIEALIASLKVAEPALAEARKLKDLPKGRYPVFYDQNGLPAAVPHVQAARQTATLLAYDVLLREQAQDMDGGLESCRGIMNVARSLGDEPDCHLQLARLELRATGCRRIERTLAQGQPSEASLAAIQSLLEEEESQPLFLIGARGFRASMDQLLEAARDGSLPMNGPQRWAATGLAVSIRPATLRLATHVVEIAKLPVEEQGQELKQRGLPKPEDVSFPVRLYILPRVQKVSSDLSRGQIRTQAELRCAIVAVAAERYRRAHGSWPGSPTALVPAYLRAVPIDPFDGQPVRFRRLADGVVIYCLGPDGQDNKGKLDRKNPGVSGTDVGLQLWDVDKRQQPPLAPAGEPQAPDGK
jgi:hypothetical protein